MQKLAGGNLLECGHHQVISSFRKAAHDAGYTQRPVWCIECNDWRYLNPNNIIDKLDDSVLELS